MCSPSIPEPPDPKETAAAQTGTNVSTAIANSILGNVNQVTPYGSLNYTYDQKFVNDDNGQTWWLGPDGQYQKEAPAGVGAVTNSNTAQSGGFGGGERLNQRGETSAAADANGRQRQGQGQTQVPDGWSQVNGYYIPSWTATQTLSPEQQKLYETGLQAKQNLSDLAVSQSSRLQDLLGTPFDLSGAPAAGDPSKLSMPNLPTYEKYASAPSLATSFGDAGDINSNYMTSFGDAGKINKEFVKSFDDAGPITRTYNTDFSEDRDKVEQALMERLQPYIDRDNEAMRSQLLNSGVRQDRRPIPGRRETSTAKSTMPVSPISLPQGRSSRALSDLSAIGRRSRTRRKTRTSNKSTPALLSKIRAFSLRTMRRRKSSASFFLYDSVSFRSQPKAEGGLRVGYSWRDGEREVALFGRNITNAMYATSGIDFNNLTGMLNEPRIWGVQFSVKF